MAVSTMHEAIAQFSAGGEYHAFGEFDASLVYYTAHGRADHLFGQRRGSGGAAHPSLSSRRNTAVGSKSSEEGEKSSTGGGEEGEDHGSEPARKKAKRDAAGIILDRLESEHAALVAVGTGGATASTSASSTATSGGEQASSSALRVRKIVLGCLDSWRQDCDRKEMENAEADFESDAAASVAKTAAKQSRTQLLETTKQLLLLNEILKQNSAGNSSSTVSDQQQPLSSELLTKIEDFCVKMEEQEYEFANQAYMHMTIGNTKWHQTLASSEARHNKGAKTKIIKKTGGTEFAESDEIHDHVWALKRLLTAMQKVRPAR
ncbi:unnamed protein product [Amoebophrya sp. A25]|nr:unnamed protein product [Amoebophrya sp. A25]|eukprot:GSA25T00002059001.1